jgi:hypothetical protein
MQANPLRRHRKPIVTAAATAARPERAGGWSGSPMKIITAGPDSMAAKIRKGAGVFLGSSFGSFSSPKRLPSPSHPGCNPEYRVGPQSPGPFVQPSTATLRFSPHPVRLLGISHQPSEPQVTVRCDPKT